jgi:hypothetical protein
MFIIPCKYVKGKSQIKQCITSIQKYHPEEKIIVVDSFSDDISYTEDIIKLPNVSVLDKQNSNYIVGALWKTYEAFPDEHHYVLIHDSMIINKPLTKFLQDDQTYSFLYFIQEPQERDQPVIDRFVGPHYIHTPGWPMIGVFGTAGILKNDLMKKFIKNDLHKTFLPINKDECMVSERAIGVLFSLEGINFMENSVEKKNILEHWSYTHPMEFEYITKIITQRQ